MHELGAIEQKPVFHVFFVFFFAILCKINNNSFLFFCFCLVFHITVRSCFVSISTEIKVQNPNIPVINYLVQRCNVLSGVVQVSCLPPN